jgi:hypothetical protein
MTNPLIHALVFLAAVIIPGGLLVYFAWRLRKKTVIPPTPEEARTAFREMFPVGSLRADNRLDKLKRYKRRKSRPPKKSQ